MFAYVEGNDQLKTKSEEFKRKCQHTTLRNYIKLCNRLKKLHLKSNNKKYLDHYNWK